MLWEEAYAELLTQHGFRRGKASPCCFWHPGRQISLVCHGDDFTSLGDEDSFLMLVERETVAAIES